MKAGAQFSNNEWSETWTQDNSFEEKPLDWPGRGEKHIRSYIRPKVTVSYYSVTSSQISIEPYSNYNAAVDNYPFWCWKLDNGIEGTYGFQFQLFDSQIPNYSKDLNKVQWIIESDCESIEDVIAPSQIDDLSAINITPYSIRLVWSSTGDDADMGKASEYDIRYSKSFIDGTNWSKAIQCSPTPNPQSASNTEEYLLDGLSPETSYYFALKVADEIPNWSPISNIAMTTTEEAMDVISPSEVSDLFAGSPTANSLTLTWSAPGDNGNVGTATQYDIRFSTEYISPYEWDTYVACPNVPTPSISGSDEEYIVTNLVPNTIYYFAIKSADEVLNWFDMSNMAGEKTTGRGSIIDEFTSPVSSYTLDLAGAGSSLWIINSSGDTVYNINLTDGTLNNKFNFVTDESMLIRGIAFDGVNLWIATLNDIYKVDPNNGNKLDQFTYANTIQFVSGLTWADGKLWLAGTTENIAYEISVDQAILDGHSGNSITNQIIFSNSSYFRGIMYFEDGLFISTWTNSESATVYEYDISTEKIRQQFQIRELNPLHNPIQGGLATDGTFLYTGGDNLRILKIKY